MIIPLPLLRNLRILFAHPGKRIRLKYVLRRNLLVRPRKPVDVRHIHHTPAHLNHSDLVGSLALTRQIPLLGAVPHFRISFFPVFVLREGEKVYHETRHLVAPLSSRIRDIRPIAGSKGESTNSFREESRRGKLSNFRRFIWFLMCLCLLFLLLLSWLRLLLRGGFIRLGTSHVPQNWSHQTWRSPKETYQFACTPSYQHPLFTSTSHPTLTIRSKSPLRCPRFRQILVVPQKRHRNLLRLTPWRSGPHRRRRILIRRLSIHEWRSAIKILFISKQQKPQTSFQAWPLALSDGLQSFQHKRTVSH